MVINFYNYNHFYFIFRNLNVKVNCVSSTLVFKNRFLHQ